MYEHMIELRTQRVPRWTPLGGYDYFESLYVYCGVWWGLEVLENRNGFNSVAWGLMW